MLPAPGGPNGDVSDTRKPAADSDRPAPPRARRRRRWLIAAAAAVIAVVGALVATTTHQPTRVSHPQEAKAFALPDLRDPDRTISLAAFRGTPVVVNFWASWCVPCRKEMPDFERVAEDERDRVAFVGVNHQDSRHDALALLHDTGVRYPVAYDPAGKTALAYGLFGMPTTLFIGPDGRLLGRHTGQVSAADLRQSITTFFHEP